MSQQTSQRAKLLQMFTEQPMRRAAELRMAGINPATIARAMEDGELERIGRGLYIRPEFEFDKDQALAEAAMRVPKGVIAMTSALAYHDLTDQMPRRVWMAIARHDWAPTPSHPPIRTIRFSDRYLHQGVEMHEIAGMQVPIYSVAKTLADMFRNPQLVDRSVAIEGLRAALNQRKASPASIAEAAKAAGAWTRMRPYLEALTSNG